MPGGFSSFVSSISSFRPSMPSFPSFRPSAPVSASKLASAPQPGVAPVMAPGSNGVHTSNAATDALRPTNLRFGAGVWRHLLPIFSAVGSIAWVVVYSTDVLGLGVAAFFAAFVTIYGLIAITVTLRYITGTRNSLPTGVFKAYTTTAWLTSVAGAGGVLYALYYAIDQNSYLTLLLISTQAIIAVNLAVALCTTALTLVVILSQGVQSCIRGWRPGDGVTDVSHKAPGEVEAGKGLLAAIREAWKAAEKAFQGGANSGVERPPGYSAVPAVETAV